MTVRRDEEMDLQRRVLKNDTEDAKKTETQHTTVKKPT